MGGGVGVAGLGEGLLGGLGVAGQGVGLGGGVGRKDGHLRQRFHAVVEGGGSVGGAGSFRRVLGGLVGDRQLAGGCPCAAAVRGRVVLQVGPRVSFAVSRQGFVWRKGL